MDEFDIVVIGGGPGGYPAAIKAAQLGKKVALIEAAQLGGTCLNRGCIPSKALIENARVLQSVKEAEKFGVVTGSVEFNFAKMAARKDQVVSNVRKGLEGLIAANNIYLIQGFGEFISPKEIKISGKENKTIRTQKTIIATGSEPKTVPSMPIDHKRILDSTSLLEITDLPKSIVIVGAGFIGCEFASLYTMLGVEVKLLEMLPRIIPMESVALSEALAKNFKRKGIQIETNILVEGIENLGEKVRVKLAGGKTIEADIALVSIGRSMNTEKIGLDKAGVIVQPNGMIPVNDKMETNIRGIYAVGDIASKWWLAHVASHQGLVAAQNACGIEAHMNYNAVPNVIFTNPEIATVGMSLDEALEKGYQATLGSFPFSALGKSQAALQTEGFAQIVKDRYTGQIYGAQVMGHDASTLIAEITVAIANELTVESVIHTIHAHPTIAEVWLEAALVSNETPLHFPPKSRKTS